MNLLTSIPFLKTKINPRQILAQNWSDRHQILEKDVNLFCWQRDQNQQIHLYLRKLLTIDIPPIVLSVDLENLGNKLSKSRKIWDADHSEEADAFWVDVFQLTRDFLEFSNEGKGTIHLKPVNDNACAKFHTDGYSLRLFTTYLGDGTEWLPERATNRRALGKNNGSIVKNPTQVQQMKSFEVGILKGERPTRSVITPGIVHKSPKITNTDRKRIILRVDI